MFSSSSCAYGGKLQSRCLVAQEANSEQHRFLIGSTSLREENEVQLIDYNQESGMATCLHVFPHAHEIWHMSPSPRDASLLITSFHGAQGPGAVLWKMNSTTEPDPLTNDAQSDDVTSAPDGRARSMSLANANLDEVTTFECVDGLPRILWEPKSASTNQERLVALDEHSFRVLDMSEASVQVTDTSSASVGRIMAGALDPYGAGHTLSSVSGVDISVWDCRISITKPTINVEGAHEYGSIRDIDYNPNKRHVVATSGEDRLIKFWDLRSPGEPMRILAGHSHWVPCIKFNRFHDQLLVSGGTDSYVNLWRVSSISSAPLLELEGEGNCADAGDASIRTFDDHEDSVYAVAWSACDAWVFASLSYDGRVVFNNVPSTEKYKILL